jgi:acetylornithine deacetylase/succinyl-diaminopimelate desuccinylase-like protein
LVDPQKTKAIQNYFAEHDLGKYSLLRTSISPTIVSGGFRENVIPSHAEAMLDIRALRGLALRASEIRVVRRHGRRRYQVESGILTG